MARALLLASAVLLACAAGASAVVHDTLSDAIVAEKLGNFAAVAAFVGANDELAQKGAAVTVFAPTDKALDDFAVSMGYKKASDLLKPQFIPLLRYVLANHITFKPIKGGELKDGQKIDVMSDRQLSVTKKDGAFYLDGAKVAKADVMTKDGNLHVVDSVIRPPNVYKDMKAAFAANPDWSQFGKAVADVAPEVFKAAADPSTAGTVFVPDNKAIEKFLQQTNSTLDDIKANKNKTREALATLTYHIVPGLAIDAPSLTDDRVLQTALVVDKKPRRLIVERKTSPNGKEAIKLVGDLGSAYLFDRPEVYAGAEALYTIDDVLVPSLEGGAMGVSVMDVLEAQGLTGFAKLLKTLKVDDEFNNVNFDGAVLAPTNEAIDKFAKTIGRTPESLLERPGLLRELAGYHIVPDLSAQASKIAEAGTLVLPTVAGDNVTFVAGKDKKSLQVKGFHGNSATLLDEYTAGRGKVYKIDTVLLPADVWPNCYDALTAFADPKVTGGKLSALKKAVDATPSVKKALQDPMFKGTILAPGDEAFNNLPKAAKDALAGPNGKKTLENVLLYHVLTGDSYSVPYKWPTKPTELETAFKGHKLTADRKMGPEARTSLGGTTPYQIMMTPEVGSAGKKADGLEYNLFCANAVLHAIDQVLLPKL